MTSTNESIEYELDFSGSEINELLRKFKDTQTSNISYTNVLPISTTNDGVTIYNKDKTPGYKANTRISSDGSDKADNQAVGVYITGFIKVDHNDVVRLKNIDMKNNGEAWTSTCVVNSYLGSNTGKADQSANGAQLTKYQGAVWDSDNNLVQFTVGLSNGYTTGYIRLICTGINSKSVITINEEIPEDVEEVKIANLEESVSKLTSKVEELESVETDNRVPEYWKDALEEGCEAINTALCAAGYDKSAFLFYTDAHWNYGAEMSPTLLKYLYRHTGMTKTFYGGDIVNNEADDYDTMKYLWDWRNKLKDLPNHHSAVGNHDDGNATNNLFSEQYVYGFLLAAEETPDIVRGVGGMYYYVDSPSEKTRYLFLDTAYKGVDDKQQEFIKEALKTVSDNWHVVAIAHIWHDTDYDAMKVGNINHNASIVLSIFDTYNSRLDEFIDCKGRVEFCVGGHTHIDHDSTTATGIPIILVETDSYQVRSGLTATQGTTTESSVNGIIADYSSNKIYVVRVGRGVSRVVRITN